MNRKRNHVRQLRLKYNRRYRESGVRGDHQRCDRVIGINRMTLIPEIWGLTSAPLGKEEDGVGVALGQAGGESHEEGPHTLLKCLWTRKEIWPTSKMMRLSCPKTLKAKLK